MGAFHFHPGTAGDFSFRRDEAIDLAIVLPDVFRLPVDDATAGDRNISQAGAVDENRRLVHAGGRVIGGIATGQQDGSCFQSEFHSRTQFERAG